MAKVWKDLNDLTFAEVPSNLKKYDDSMKAIPKHNNGCGSRKVYQRKEYCIYATNNSFIVHNTKKDFEKGHTHTNNFNFAKSIIDLSIRKKIPHRPSKRLVGSLIRVAKDNKYIEELESL